MPDLPRACSVSLQRTARSQRTLLRPPSKRGSRLRMQPERFCVYVFSVAEDGIEASVSERVGVWQDLTLGRGRRGEL